MQARNLLRATAGTGGRSIPVVPTEVDDTVGGWVDVGVEGAVRAGAVISPAGRSRDQGLCTFSANPYNYRRDRTNTLKLARLLLYLALANVPYQVVWRVEPLGFAVRWVTLLEAKVDAAVMAALFLVW